MNTIKNIIILFLIFTYWIILGAVALKTLYIWFFVPIFHTPVISLAQAAGLNLFIGWVFSRINENKELTESNVDLDEYVSVVIAYTISITVRVLFVLAFGWALLFFI